MGNLGYEPFTHHRIPWKYWCPFEVFMPEHPNVDIAHGGNVSWKRWTKRYFIKKPKFWEESMNYAIPGWENLKNIVGK